MKRPDLFTSLLILSLAIMLLWLFGILGKLSWSFLIPSANAADAELSWTHPTQYTDNTPLPIAQIARTDIQYGLCATGNTSLLPTPPPVTVAVPTALTAFTVTPLNAGRWCFAVRTAATNGEVSVWTPFVTKVVAPPAPKAPTNLVVTITVVYTVVKQRDAFVMLPVGTAPAGTECITSQSVNGYYVVPRAAVTFTGNVQPEVVVSTCG